MSTHSLTRVILWSYSVENDGSGDWSRVTLIWDGVSWFHPSAAVALDNFFHLISVFSSTRCAVVPWACSADTMTSWAWRQVECPTPGRCFINALLSRVLWKLESIWQNSVFGELPIGVGCDQSWQAVWDEIISDGRGVGRKEVPEESNRAFPPGRGRPPRCSYCSPSPLQPMLTCIKVYFSLNFSLRYHLLTDSTNLPKYLSTRDVLF